MNRKFDICEVRGTTESSIDWVYAIFTYEEDGYESSHAVQKMLSASLPVDASDEEIIEELENSMGSQYFEQMETESAYHIEYQKQKDSVKFVHRAETSMDHFTIGQQDDLEKSISKLVEFIRFEMNKHLQNGVEVDLSFGTYTYDSSRTSMNLLDHARLDADLRADDWENNPKKWRMKDGSWVQLSKDDIEVVRVALAKHLEKCFSWFEHFETLARQSESTEQLIQLKEQVANSNPNDL